MTIALVYSLPMRVLLFLLLCQVAIAQTNNSRRLPPPGIPIPAEDRSALEESLRQLQEELSALANKSLSARDLLLLPDAQVYEKAVRYALEHNEFYRPEQFQTASQLLEEGLRRTRALDKNAATWSAETGLLVRGYKSKIDQSVQPYGLVVPEGYSPFDGKR